MLNPKRFFADKGGATAIEYGLIAALIAVAAIGGMSFFADSAVGMWDYVSSSLPQGS